MQLVSSQAFVAAMERAGYTVRGLAERVGCSPAMIGHLRTGFTEKPNRKLAAAIEDQLGVRRGSLFKYTRGECTSLAHYRSSCRAASAHDEIRPDEWCAACQKRASRMAS